MKSRNYRGGDEEGEGNKKMKMKKNMKRMGGRGGGLSLQAFANAKSSKNGYNPALLKKKKEFYKNAKQVGKYKKMIKQQYQQNDPSSSTQPAEEQERRGGGDINKKHKKNKGSYSLNDLYEKKREEEEKARKEREDAITAKREEQERAEARRKALREKMYKKTRKGQPVMKYRIEHLLETLQSSK